MSIESKITSLESTISDIKESIQGKNVPLGDNDGFIVYPDAVRAISNQNFNTTELKPTIHGVNYYDYNGDLLYVYTPQEFASLTEHPSLPTHTGLTANGWNWDLSDAKTFVANTCDCLNIGAQYYTTSGSTEVYFTIKEDDSELHPWRLYFRVKKTNSSSASLTVDWGDNSSESYTSITTSWKNANVNHLYYAHSGSYCIKITGTSNCIYTVGSTASYSGAFGYGYTAVRHMIVSLEKVFFAQNTQLTDSLLSYWGVNTREVCVPGPDYSSRAKGITANVFSNSYSLKGLTLPNGITTIGASSFQYMSSAKCICFSKSAGTTFGNNSVSDTRSIDSIIIAATCTSLGTNTFGSSTARRIFINGTLTTIPENCFNYCDHLVEVGLPSTVTTIGVNAFRSNRNLEYLEFSNSLTAIGNTAFTTCTHLKTIVFHSTTPPSAGTTIFDSCPNLTYIYVPYSSDHSILSAYQQASGWTAYASKMYELDSNGNIPT